MTENNTALGKVPRYLPYLMLALVLAVVAYVRIRLLQVPLERDEGEYAYMGQLLLKGAPPYLYAYSMKLPGVSVVYALFMALFGQTPVGVHLGLLIVNGACIWLVYLLAARVISRDAAPISCASFALLSLSKTVYGIFAHATQFIVMFTLAGFILLLRPSGRNRAGVLFLSGLCFGMAFIMKQPAALLGIFAFLYLAWDAYKDRAADRRRLPGLLLFLLGLALPYALVLLWVLRGGSFANFWFWTVTYAREYASSQSFEQGLNSLVRALAVITQPQMPLWLLAAAGALFLACGRPRSTNRLFVAGFLLFSFLALCPGLYFRWHYFILILPGIALLIGAAATALAELLVGSRAGRCSQRSLVATLLVISAIGYSFYRERLCFFNLSPEQVSYSTYGASPFPAAPRIGAYLRERTSGQDRIAVLGSDPEIYFYAGRLSATGHIYMYSLMEDQPFAERMQSEMVRQIEQSRPKYCVFTKMDYSWLVGPASRREVFYWIEKYLKEHYEQVGVVEVYGDSSQCLWDAAAATYTPRSDAHLIVYKRKG